MPDRPIELVYKRLLECYGPQFWWPAESAFEVMVGAILTQNTAWINVERALKNLKRLGLLSARAITQCPHPCLAEALRPSGYYNVKAHRLRSFCAWFLANGGFVTDRIGAVVMPAERSQDIDTAADLAQAEAVLRG